MRPRAVIVSMVTAGLVAAVVTASLDRPAPPDDMLRPTAPSATATAGSNGGKATPEPLPTADRVALANAVTAAVNDVAPGTELGLAVHDRHTGSVVARTNADRAFYTASVVKLLIVTDVLRSAGWRVPRDEERTALRGMLRRSADGVAGALWEAGGGPAIDERMAGLMGLAHTTPPRDPAEWELTTMSPRDVVDVYRYLLDDMPHPAGRFVLGALRSATDRGADGFDQRFGLRSAMPGATRAIKQGWMRVSRGLVLNTTGLVGAGDRYVVALLTLQPPRTDVATGRKAVTAGIEALAPVLTAATR